MKTPLALALAVAGLVLLALNLVESVRIRKALCSEYTVSHRSLAQPEPFAIETFKQYKKEETALGLQGFRCVGSHIERGITYMDFARVNRGQSACTYEQLAH